MTNAQWDILLKSVNGEVVQPTPVAFIIDSPWLPGWAGCSTLDYYTSDEVWFEANRKAIEAFPDAIFLPGFWSEYGMCTEPSAFGAKCRWEDRNLPHAERTIPDLEATFAFEKPDPRKDGLLPFVVNRLRRKHDDVRRMGHEYRIAVARGPLNIASFLCGTTEFLMGLRVAEENTVRVLDAITDFLVDWVGVQIETFPTIDGLLVLDDLIGFLGPDDFRQFALPRLKKIYGSFNLKVNFLHNDARGLVCAPHLAEAGINLFNFSHEHGLEEMRKLTDGKVTLLGNIPPRDVLAAGTPEQIAASVREAKASVSSMSRVLLSCGGGVPPNVTTEQMNAFIRAARE